MSTEKSLYSSIRNRSNMPFQFFMGARGIGKTYSAVQMVDEEATDYNRFLYLRRSEREIEMLANDMGNPFKKYNAKTGADIQTEITKKFGFIERGENTLGYILALSTFSNFRGMDFSDVGKTIFDEFIVQKEKVQRDLGTAFLNFYESVNRNRELEGMEPMTVYFLSNSISIRSDILLAFGIAGTVARMIAEGKKRKTIKNRGIYIELMENKQYEKEKGKTVLYKATEGTAFAEEALHNEFTSDNLDLIRDVKIVEFLPEIRYGDYVIYKHKSNGSLHIRLSKDSAPTSLKESQREKLYFSFAPFYRMAKREQQISFDSYATEIFFDNVLSRNI